MASAARFTVAGLVGMAMLATPALADELTYVNARFGTQFTLPAHMFTQIAPPPENGDGITMTGENGTVLAVFGAFNALGETARQMRDRIEQGRKTAGDSVTYRASGENWLVVSGHAGDLIYYERHEFGADDTIHSAAILFPSEMRARFEPLVEQFARRLSGP